MVKTILKKIELQGCLSLHYLLYKQKNMKILRYKQKIVQLNYGNSHKVEYYVDIENDVAEYLIT